MNPACFRAGMLFRMATSPALISFYVVWSRPHTSESVSRRDYPILLILILHSLVNLVAAAQHILPGVCTDVEWLSSSSARVTKMLHCCSAFARFDLKFPVAWSQILSFYLHNQFGERVDV